VRTLLLLVMGPVAFALGYGAMPLAVFLAAFGFGLEVFPGPDQRWMAFGVGIGATVAVLMVVWRLFRVYDRMIAGVRGDIMGAGPVRGEERWACTGCGASVTVHDVACMKCGTLNGRVRVRRG
jgi:hypothetical protein